MPKRLSYDVIDAIDGQYVDVVLLPCFRSREDMADESDQSLRVG